MYKPLLGEKLAVLVANGFNEQDMTESQKALQVLGADIRIIGMDHGLLSSWTGSGWGHNYAADAVLSTALAVDFSMLVIPSGRRSIEKLKLTAHTKRFISGFIDAGKPVVAFHDALELLVFSDKLEGCKVSGPEPLQSKAIQTGATWEADTFVVDGNLLTGCITEGKHGAFVEAISQHLMTHVSMNQAA